MKFCPPKTSKACRKVQKVAKSPFNVTAARFVFTGSPIIFSKSHKTTYGAAVKLRGHLPSASTRFYWCLEAFMDVSRQNNCVELPLDVHKTLSTPGKICLGRGKNLFVWLLPHKWYFLDLHCTNNGFLVPKKNSEVVSEGEDIFLCVSHDCFRRWACQWGEP